MGRRAKNKQGDPAPLVDKNAPRERESAKKLGKRKADPEAAPESKRPAKKAKESASGAKVKASKGKAVKGKGQAKDKGESWDDLPDGGSEGWEDVEDGGNLMAQTKYAYVVYILVYVY